MALVLPSTVEELNFMQHIDLPAAEPTNMYVKESNKGFENIFVEKRYKREVSLPNGVQNWNISNFDPYLNFDDNIQANNNFKAVESHNDRLVPEEGELRQRCGSFSSVSSSMDEKCLVFPNLAVKTFNTVHMDSGSTCITSDHSYVNTSTPVFKDLDEEETYQNLDTFFKQVPDVHASDSLSSVSPVGSPMNDSNLEYSTLGNNYSVNGSCSQDSFADSSLSLKRAADTSVDELFFINASKRNCESPNGSHYLENRKKNNIASKNCRKTRKEKQKEMEAKVSDLEKEKGELTVKVQVLEELIQAHKLKLYAILQKR